MQIVLPAQRTILNDARGEQNHHNVNSAGQIEGDVKRANSHGPAFLQLLYTSPLAVLFRKAKTH